MHSMCPHGEEKQRGPVTTSISQIHGVDWGKGFRSKQGVRDIYHWKVRVKVWSLWQVSCNTFSQIARAVWNLCLGDKLLLWFAPAPWVSGEILVPWAASLHSLIALCSQIANRMEVEISLWNISNTITELIFILKAAGLVMSVSTSSQSSALPGLFSSSTPPYKNTQEKTLQLKTTVEFLISPVF